MQLTPEENAWLWQVVGAYQKGKELAADIIVGKFTAYGKPDALALMETIRLQTNLLTEFIKKIQ